MASSKRESDRLHNEEETPTSKANLDTILIEAFGHFGRHQFRILLLAVILSIFTAFSSLEYVFSTARINTRCLIPECEDAEVAAFSPPWVLNAMPLSEGHFYNCLRYKPSNNTVRSDACPAEWFIRDVTVVCSEFVYENTNSIVYDYGLACDEWRRTFVGVVHTFGGLLALPITGLISDRWGRRVALIWNTVNTAWLGIARYWCNSYYAFIIAEVSKATLGGGVFSCVYILVMELLGPKHRVIAGATLSMSISLGHIILSAIAWSVPDWRRLILILYVPHFLFIAYLWLMPESVRWNISVGRYKEVEYFLKKVARTNKRELTEKSLHALQETGQPKKKLKEFERERNQKEPWLILLVFRHKEILKRCCVSPVWWITCTLIYYGMSINSVNMSGNRYINLMAVAASEIPGYWLAMLLMDRIGRKPVLIGAYWTCAACQLAYIFLPKHMYMLSLPVYLVGKFSIAMVMMSLYIFTSEIYPTNYRHSLLAFSSMIGRIGSIVAPLTPAFGATIARDFPSALFCGFAFVAGALVLLAPETLGTKLPDTMEEASTIGIKRAKQ